MAMQVLIFEVDGQRFAVEIAKVVEVRRWTGASRLPSSSPSILGVINVRGDVVSIVGLREFFRVARCEYGSEHVIILVRVACDGREPIVGMVVDAVADVVDLEAASIHRPPASGGAESGNFVQNVAIREQETLLVLDVDALLATATGIVGGANAA